MKAYLTSSNSLETILKSDDAGRDKEEKRNTRALHLYRRRGSGVRSTLARTRYGCVFLLLPPCHANMDETEQSNVSPHIFVSSKVPVILEAASNPQPFYAWREVLDIPANKLAALKFSHFPFKWIRYAMGAIVGPEGHLYENDQTTPGQPIDYKLPLPETDDLRLYYHVPEDQLPHMFPLDLQLADTRAVTSSVRSNDDRQGVFLRAVRERDGAGYVVSGFPAEYCQAAHLVAHGKGSEVRCLPFSFTQCSEPASTSKLLLEGEAEFGEVGREVRLPLSRTLTTLAMASSSMHPPIQVSTGEDLPFCK